VQLRGASGAQLTRSATIELVLSSIQTVTSKSMLVRISPHEGTPTAVEHVSIGCVPTNSPEAMIHPSQKIDWCEIPLRTTPSQTGPNTIILGPRFFGDPQVLKAVCPNIFRGKVAPERWNNPRQVLERAQERYFSQKRRWLNSPIHFHGPFLSFDKPVVPREFSGLTLVYKVSIHNGNFQS